MREQKVEKLKNIDIDNYRREHAKPEATNIQATTSRWYVDQEYSPDELDACYEQEQERLKYAGNYRKLRNIREQDEYYDDERHLDGPRGEGEGSPDDYGIQRSTSCKEFQYPKSQSFCFDSREYGGETKTAAPISILKKSRTQVPKSYSFSAGCRSAPCEMSDYDLPQPRMAHRARQEAFRKSANYYYSHSLDDSTLPHTAVHDAHSCCARDHCTNAKCFLDDMYTTYHQPNWCRGSSSGLYGAGASSGSSRNLHAAEHIDCCWYDERCNHRVATVPCYLPHACEQPQPPPPTVICCCAADDCCCRRQQQRHMARPRSRLYCAGHQPISEEEQHLHCRAYNYDTDLEHFIRDERERLLLQDKFLDEDERYLSSAAHYPSGSYRRPARSKSPICYEEDTCSDSTEMDLEDFNIDLEKYWEELEKPPSPVDIDMQRRNMHSNLKVKNVNVGYYNNGQPIEMPPGACTEQLLPQNNNGDYHFFEQAGSPLHRSYYNCHKVYPTAENLPTYKYNNFYPEHGVQTQQPSSGAHHASAGGHSALSLINNIFSIYKPNKYAPHNCQINDEPKPEPCKKMNVPSTRRPLGAPHSEYMHSMKRPLIVSTEQPHFKIIPEKTGLKISPLYSYDDYGEKARVPLKLSSTARPLMLPH